jgi:hypothetical protein
VYALTLPYSRLPSPRLVLETSDRVFQRPVQVVVERRADREHRDAWFDVKAATVWVHMTPDAAAHAAMLPLAIQEETELLVVVDERDHGRTAAAAFVASEVLRPVCARRGRPAGAADARVRARRARVSSL